MKFTTHFFFSFFCTQLKDSINFPDGIINKNYYFIGYSWFEKKYTQDIQTFKILSKINILKCFFKIDGV
jgi:hypothetical protein